jgi:hypothetical protein
MLDWIKNPGNPVKTTTTAVVATTMNMMAVAARPRRWFRQEWSRWEVASSPVLLCTPHSLTLLFHSRYRHHLERQALPSNRDLETPTKAFD